MNQSVHLVLSWSLEQTPRHAADTLIYPTKHVSSPKDFSFISYTNGFASIRDEADVNVFKSFIEKYNI